MAASARKLFGLLRKFQNVFNKEPLNHLQGLIMTMVILYMTKHKTFLFVRQQTHFSIILP